MQAIIVTGGKQYNVKEGDVIYIEKLAAEADATVTFDQVLAVVDGENSKFGQEDPCLQVPFQEGLQVPQGPQTALHQGADREDRSVMTRVEFFDQDGRISGFCCSGHSGYAEAGSDIVCAAVSTAVKFAETTLSEVLGERVKTKVNEEEARITLHLPATCEDEDAAQAVLTGMMLTLCSLRDEYPDHIEVLEV